MGSKIPTVGKASHHRAASFNTETTEKAQRLVGKVNLYDLTILYYIDRKRLDPDLSIYPDLLVIDDHIPFHDAVQQFAIQGGGGIQKSISLTHIGFPLYREFAGKVVYLHVFCIRS